MGCDIHLYVERRLDAGGYLALVDGAFDLPRDYDFFFALAGVRRDSVARPYLDARGLPSDVSPEVGSHYYLPVMHDHEALGWGIGEHVTPDHAKELVDSGRSHRWTNEISSPLMPSTQGYVSNPDWHHPSWLTHAELAAALQHANYAANTASVEIRLLLGYLDAAQHARLYPSRGPGLQLRPS